MQQMLLRSLGLGGVVLSFGFLGRFISRALGLSGWQLWALQIGFVVLGAIMAWIVYLFIKGKQKSAPKTTPSTEDLAATWNEAKERLAASQRIEHDRIGRIPLMLVVGPADGAKTTTVVRSGLEPELLSGAAVEGDTVIPTRGINTWYGGGWLFVEAASDVFDDEERWDWTARSLRPDRLAAALSGARQAPRAVVLCYPCSRLGEAGGQLRTEAQAIRTKLSKLAETLGSNLPVYLLLTKLDQVSNFTDFTRGLTTDEAHEILGATLRRGGALSSEAYATAETKQVTAAFDSMVRTLALRRTDLLQRETGEDVRAGAYEFPRELSKLRTSLADFIVELGRPTQFGVGPFVRGFYFTGVRPIVVDASPAYAQPSAPAAPMAAGATMVFNPNAPPPTAAAPIAATGSRRVPQWVFLPRLVRGLIFEDRAALAVTESGVRVSGLRRALLGLATAAALVFAFGFTTSFFSNRGLEKRVVAAAEGTAAIGEAGGSVTPETLASLDSLGLVFGTLREFEQEGPPWRYRWGLYPGNSLLNDTRRVYFSRFQSLLNADAQAALLASLQRAVATRDPADREPTYQGLKSYLMTHARNDRATESFLPGELLRFWAGGREVDSEIEAVVTRQFATYARELPFGDPLNLATDSALVVSTRAYLLDAASSDRIYQAVTGSVEAKDVRFANQFGGQRIVTNSHVVPGAYTREGWTEVQAKLSGNLVDAEDWVTDAPPPEPENIEQLRATLKKRYETDYIRQWQSYLEAGAVSGFGEVTVAFEALEIVADPSSPLLGMIGLASAHTVVDSAVIEAFAPAHHTVPAVGGPVSEVNQPYLQAVNTLASSLRTVAEAQGPTREAASIGANGDARRVSQAVAQISVGMNAAPAGESARRHVRRLLETPIERAMGVLGALPTDELNGSGGSFCREMNRVTGDYPFNRQSTTDADPEEVAVAFGAESSTLWNFYQENLKGIISEAGGRFRRAAGASPRPTDEFVAFFDRAARVSRGLFPTQGRNVEILLSVAVPPPAGIDEIVIENNAQRLRFTDRDRASKTMRWTPDPSSRVRILAVSGSNTIPILEASGTWSLFRIFKDADWASQGAEAYSVTWRNTDLNGPLSGRVSFAGAPDVDILNPDLIGNVSCVGRIVR